MPSAVRQSQRRSSQAPGGRWPAAEDSRGRPSVRGPLVATHQISCPSDSFVSLVDPRIALPIWLLERPMRLSNGVS